MGAHGAQALFRSERFHDYRERSSINAGGHKVTLSPRRKSSVEVCVKSVMGLDRLRMKVRSICQQLVMLSIEIWGPFGGNASFFGAE